jgi:hypothetical protein
LVSVSQEWEREYVLGKARRVYDVDPTKAPPGFLAARGLAQLALPVVAVKDAAEGQHGASVRRLGDAGADRALDVGATRHLLIDVEPELAMETLEFMGP